MSESPAFSVRWPAVAVGVVHATVVNGSSGLAPVAVPRSSMSYEPMYGPQFVTLTSSDIPLPLVLNSCGEFVAVMTPHSAEKVGVVLLPPDAAPSRARAALGRRSSAAAARATAPLRMFELFMAHSIGAVRCASNRTLVLGPPVRSERVFAWTTNDSGAPVLCMGRGSGVPGASASALCRRRLASILLRERMVPSTAPQAPRLRRLRGRSDCSISRSHHESQTVSSSSVWSRLGFAETGL